MRAILLGGGLAAALGLGGGGALAQPADDAPPPYSTGLVIADPADLTIYRSFKRTRSQSYYPPRVDLAPSMPPVGDQGRQGSCVSWAVGYVAGSHYWAAQAGVDVRDRRNNISPASIHNVAQAVIQRDRPGRCDPQSGSNFKLTFNIMEKFGALPFSRFPYEDQDCDKLPPTVAKQVPADVRRSTFFSRRAESLASDHDIKRVLSRGEPVIAGILTTRDFMRWVPGKADVKDVYRYQRGPMNTGQHGNHALTIVGYDEQRRAYKLMNSWGAKWGDDGFMWIDYDSFDRLNLLKQKTGGKVAAYRLVAAGAPDVTPPPSPSPPPAPPRPKPAPVVKSLEGLRDLLDNSDCAALEFDRANDDVRVRGFIKDAEALASLKSAIGRKFPAFAFSYDVALRPWPQCEVLLTLQAPLSQPSGLAIRVAGETGAVRLGEDSILAIEASAPAWPAYIYLSYIQADGSVVHLIQPENVLDLAATPGERYVFGDGREGRDRFRVSGPFGDELVFAVATASPLFAEARPSVDSDRDYLTALRQALLRQEGGGDRRQVAAAFLAIETFPKAKE